MADLAFYYFLFLSGALGAVFGSFITALTHRQHAGESISTGRSACPNCSHELSAKDLIPIFSYLFLRGKCRYCHSPLSSQYLLIELGTALAFMMGFYYIHQQSQLNLLEGVFTGDIVWILTCFVVLFACIVLLMALLVYDYRWSLLPDRWTVSLIIILLLVTAAASVLNKPLLWQPYAPVASVAIFWQTLLSGVLSGAFFLAIIYGSEWILKRPGMGMGDAKLAVGLGLLLGYPGIIVGLYLAFIFGAVLSLLLIAGKRKALGNTIPFGPFMIGGAFAALWLTPHLLIWYSKLFW